MIIIIINVYQWVFVLATGQPIKFPTYYTKKKFCQETPARNRPEKLERAKNIFWEDWLKNFLSYFLGRPISNCLVHDDDDDDDDDNDDKNHGKI